MIKLKQSNQSAMNLLIRRLFFSFLSSALLLCCGCNSESAKEASISSSETEAPGSPDMNPAEDNSETSQDEQEVEEQEEAERGLDDIRD